MPDPAVLDIEERFRLARELLVARVRGGQYPNPSDAWYQAGELLDIRKRAYDALPPQESPTLPPPGG